VSTYYRRFILGFAGIVKPMTWPKEEAEAVAWSLKGSLCTAPALRHWQQGDQELSQTNPAVHSVNTRNKHQLHRPIANLSCFQKSAFYTGIKIVNSLPSSQTSLVNKKSQFKAVFKYTLLLLCRWILPKMTHDVFIKVFLFSYTISGQLHFICCIYV
jgi:hypothetical protein